MALMGHHTHLTVNQSYEDGFTIVTDDNMDILRKAMETAASRYSQVWKEVGLTVNASSLFALD